jgi:hypothetical protein
VLGLTDDGTPVMQFLDGEGTPTFTAPESMQGSAKKQTQPPTEPSPGS